MTRTSMWIARRPEDELADAIAAADRRKTLDELKIRHNVIVDNPAPAAAAGECGWCSKRRQLASMPDGASRLPQFSRLMASPAGRRAVGEPCERCVKTALGTIKRRVDAGHKDSGGATRRTKDSGEHKGTSRLDGHHVTRVAPPDRFTKMHDPLGTCSTCQEYRRLHPDVVLTAGGVPEGCAPHPWNEKPRPPTWAR
jgi:hypothetical protein